MLSMRKAFFTISPFSRHIGKTHLFRYVPTVFDNYSANVMVDERSINFGLFRSYSTKTVEFKLKKTMHLLEMGKKLHEEDKKKKSTQYLKRVLLQRYTNDTIKLDTYRELALVYCERGKLKSALKCLRDAKKVPGYEERENEFKILSAYRLCLKEKYEKGLEILSTLKLNLTNDDQRMYFSQRYTDIGNSIFNNKDPYEARVYFILAKNLLSEIDPQNWGKQGYRTYEDIITSFQYYAFKKGDIRMSVKLNKERLRALEMADRMTTEDYYYAIATICEALYEYNIMDEETMERIEKLNKMIQPHMPQLDQLQKFSLYRYSIAYYTFVKKYDEALLTIKKAMLETEKEGELVYDFEKAEFHGLASQVYLGLSNGEKASKELQEMKEVIKVIEDDSDLEIIQVKFKFFLAKLYEFYKIYDKALTIYEETFQMGKETLPPNHSILIDSYDKMIFIHATYGDLENCERIIEQFKIPVFSIMTVNALSGLYIKKHNYEKALKLLEEAEKNFHPKLEGYKDILLKLSECYKNLYMEDKMEEINEKLKEYQ